MPRSAAPTLGNFAAADSLSISLIFVSGLSGRRFCKKLGFPLPSTVLVIQNCVTRRHAPELNSGQMSRLLNLPTSMERPALARSAAGTTEAQCRCSLHSSSTLLPIRTRSESSN